MGWQGGKPASRFLCVRASVVRAQRLFGHGANGWIILTPLSAAKSACSDTGVQMDGSSPPFSCKRAPVRIRGRKWMDHPHPPFSRKERLFGHRGQMDGSFSLSAAKSACSGTRANGWIIPTPLSAAKSACSDTGGTWMDHPPFQPQKSACSDTGQMDGSSPPPFQLQKSACSDTGVQMDGSSPPFSRKKRLFGHGANGWIIPTPFQPQKCAYADTGANGWIISIPPFTRKRAPMRTRGAGG